MRTSRRALLLALLSLTLAPRAARTEDAATATAPAPKPDPWEKEIRAFEEKDRLNPPPKDGVLFVGSSSIRMWDLAKSFPDLNALNRGFGGSRIADSTRLADRIVIPYHPKTIVFYAGDNDIGGGATPEQVAEDFKAFAAKVRAALPEARLLFISIKPSIARWALVDKMRRANALIREFIAGDDHLGYIDVEKTTLGEDGQPRKELYKADGLHLNDEGYKLWAAIVGPRLREK